MVSYYIAQSKSSNHGVRESACACIAELMEKVERSSVAPHVGALLHALIVCFKDMGWPVRDAACTAFGRCGAVHMCESVDILWCGVGADDICPHTYLSQVCPVTLTFPPHTFPARCVLSHPDETWPVLESELWALWAAHLWVYIPSVSVNSPHLSRSCGPCVRHICGTTSPRYMRVNIPHLRL